MPSTATPTLLTAARLPAWCLPGDWPRIGGRPAPADIHLAEGRIAEIRPAQPQPVSPDSWALDGAPVLPGLVDAHTHLDKAFTLRRMGRIEPGLLGAIAAMHADRAGWTPADVRQRAGQALRWAQAAGVVRLRSHVDWWEPDAEPVAWPVLGELAAEWAGRIELDRAALMPLTLFADRDQALALARRVAAGGSGARLGGFVHTVNWSAAALGHLLDAAAATGLAIDLHIDEELAPAAQGLATLARLLRERGHTGRVVCGHACALAAQPREQALATLDAVARVPITLVALPITNLLLQDAQTGRTPRQRGLTLVKEARERGIPVLIASDNVQDAFCPVGSFDPVEAFAAGVLAGQLPDAFDAWSDAICRADWLGHGPPAAPLQAGAAADLVIFHDADAHGWPSRAARRVVLRAGRRLDATADFGSTA